MNIKRIAGAILLIIAAFLTISCDDIGIFAQVAVSEKIAEGLLPEGISPSDVYSFIGISRDFFSSGGALWVRNVTDRSSVTDNTKWHRVNIGGWSVIQSIAATNNYLVFTMVREDTNDHEVGLFYFNVTTGFDTATDTITNLVRVTSTAWSDNGSSFYNTRLFCPNPGVDTVYVNVLQTNGGFSSTDWSYVDSRMYSFDLTNTDWGTAIEPGGTWAELTTPYVRYIDSAAFGGGNYVFSAINNAEEVTDNGILLDEVGTVITAAVIERPVTGVTWLSSAGGGSFIAGGTSLNAGSVYPVYATNSLAGDNWVQVTGSSSDFRLQSFVDASGTTATSTVDRVLGGSRSFESDSGVGYVEIDVSGGAPGTWTISNSNLDFAYSNNYTLSDLRESSITSMSLYGGYIYASTLREGLWRLDTGVLSPSWTRE